VWHSQAHPAVRLVTDEFDRISDRDFAYRWLSCGVSSYYHGLTDFMAAHTAGIDELLLRRLAARTAEGLATSMRSS
jgi:hypothetical protein